MASELKVSRTTIRNALASLKSAGYLKARKGRGLVVAREVGGDDSLISHTVLFLTSIPTRPEQHRMSGWIEAVEIGAIEAVAEEGWHALKLHAGRLDECIDRLAASRPPGLIVTHDVTDNERGAEFVARLHAQGIPLVANGDWPTIARYDRVVPDHEAGAYLLTRWLIEHGRRRILRLWSADEHDYWVVARNAGHERAMREAGIEALPPVWVKGLFRGEVRGRDEFDVKMRLFAGHLVDWLRDGDSVDAIMATTDPDVFPIAAACRRLGKVPNEDVALVGYDNNWRTCRERPYEASGPLATVDKQNHAAGRSMARMLLDRIAGKLGAEPVRALVPPEVVPAERADGSPDGGGPR